MRRNTQKGITLVALVVTIVVLLILASITIGAVTSDNGILRNANDAKEQTEIAEEKEIVDRATIQAIGNNKRGNIVEDELQEQLDKITGDGKTEADDVGEEFEVAFTESKRYYTVDKDGTVTGPQEIVEDKSPGNITKDKNGEDLKGDENQPYEIWCIEDLCAFSNEVNNGNLFSNKTIMLMSDLNFNSKYSYVNGNITVDGNIPSCNSIEELKKVLTENEGFYPIGELYSFQGTFNGNNNKIINIYINRTINNVGLFGNIEGALIKNMSISGNISSTGDNVGGIVGYTGFKNYAILENCTNNCYVEGNTYVGGIVGSGEANVKKCFNISSIIGKTHVGGIVGSSNYGTIQFCYNNAAINANQFVGGIAGMKSAGAKIVNCYNIGQIIRK